MVLWAVPLVFRYVPTSGFSCFRWEVVVDGVLVLVVFPVSSGFVQVGIIWFLDVVILWI